MKCGVIGFMFTKRVKSHKVLFRALLIILVVFSFGCGGNDGGSDSTENPTPLIAYTLDLGVSGLGTVDIDPDQTTYSSGQKVMLTAVPNPGYHFDGWSGGISSSENPLTITMSQDYLIIGSFIVDAVPTEISNVQVVANQSTATITWLTNEPATSLVYYGITVAYELGQVEDLSLVTNHSLILTDLDAGTMYHFQVTSEDGLGHSSSTADLTFTTQTNTDGPMIDVWYGLDQSFGDIGIPQWWVNILGNVVSLNGVKTLTYSLNGGPDFPLSIGPDSRRLADEGDFNVEIDYNDLQEGSNTLIITAVDDNDNITMQPVNVSFTAGNYWPETYSIDWSQVNDIQEVAQVVDGLWELDVNGVRPSFLDYDRLIAIGDLGWSDYEVTVPVTIYGIDPSGYDPPSNGPAVGIGMRWKGHTDWDGSQPRWGFWPTGAFGWYRWKSTYERFQLAGNEYQQIAQDSSGRTVVFGSTYVFKIRVETLTNGIPYYRFKVWEQGDQEPVSWDLTIEEDQADPQSGSVLLLAHHVDASFGNVQIVRLTPQVSSLQATPQSSLAEGSFVNETGDNKGNHSKLTGKIKKKLPPSAMER